MRFLCSDGIPEGGRTAWGRRLSSLILALALAAAPLQAAPVSAEGEESLLLPGGLLCLVNREHRLSKKYIPEDLVSPRVAVRKERLRGAIQMRAAAAKALEDLFEAAMREGHVLYAVSGYRSFGIQEILFNGKVAETGSREKAQRTVAPPGASEHQLGLAMDVQSLSMNNLNRAFGSTPEGVWTGENAHRFGFILRYQKGWEKITGVTEEPWHLRYVGIAHAGAIHRLAIPLESYLEQASLLPEYILAGATDLLLADLVLRMSAGEELPPSLLKALPEQQDEALKEATLPLLSDGISYEEALRACYPAPPPPSRPRVDLDEEVHLPSLMGG